MAISLPDARQLSDEALEVLRLRALRGCELGFSEADVASILGVARGTVSRWWSAYSEGGVDALPHERTGRPQGTGRTLSDEQAAVICEILDTKSPREAGVCSPLWSRRAVRDLIKKQFDIDMPVRTVGGYLERWGYTPKKPTRRSKDQDPEKVSEWLEKTYPAIEKRASEEGATILWCDETGCAADEHPGCGYAREGKRAIIEVPNNHIRVNEISAISNEGEVHFMTYTSTMTAVVFLTFLEQLVKEVPKKIFLILDSLRAHDAAEVQQWVKEHEGQIELFYLPTYSPELNVDEYLNNDLKGGMNAEGLPDNKETLRSHIESFMRMLQQVPERVRSYFKHPCAQYAAGAT